MRHLYFVPFLFPLFLFWIFRIFLSLANFELHMFLSSWLLKVQCWFAWFSSVIIFWGGSGWVGWLWTCDPCASAYFFSKSHQHVPLQLTSSVILSVRVDCCKLTLWGSFCYVSEALVCCVWSHFNLFWEWFCFLFFDPLAVQEWVACFVCICMASVFFSLWFLALVHHV